MSIIRRYPLFFSIFAAVFCFAASEICIHGMNEVTNDELRVFWNLPPEKHDSGKIVIVIDRETGRIVTVSGK